MDVSNIVPTPVSGQTSAMVSLDTDALIAARQGAAWKISGWPENIAIHHTKWCACCHKYINHLLRAQSLGQINLQHSNIENAVQSTWPVFISSIEINADQCMQGQLSDLHVQIDELKDALHNPKKSYCNAEAALTKEHSRVKDLEQELKDLKSHLSGDNLFSTPKTSQSPSNSDLRYLWHSLDSDHLQVPETLQSTSYSKPLPAVPNATVHSSHSDPSPDIPSDGCSKTSASSEGNPETSSDSTPSDPKSGLMFFGNSLSHSGDRATLTASNIKGQVIKVIHDVKDQWGMPGDGPDHRLV